MKKKNLIYFTVGCDKSYFDLTLFCIYTLMYFNSLENTDILIMCDEEYSKHVLSKINNVPFIKIYITRENESGYHASMRKIEIFNVPIIDNYSCILYLDSDIVILGNIMELFSLNIQNDIVYFKSENNQNFSSLYYGLQNYSEDDIQRFKDNNLYPINAGHFLFMNTPSNRKHFDSINRIIASWTGPFFYEQSFLNYYFLLNGQYDGKLLNKYIDFLNSGPDSTPETERSNLDAVIVHCVNHEMQHSLKLHNMKTSFVREITKIQELEYEDREKMGKAIHLPRNSKIVEIGVFKGDFSMSLLRQFRPYMLYLIDPYEGSISSGDQDGNNVCIYDGEQLYKNVQMRFSDYPNVTLIRAKSSILEHFKDSDIDLIYIDGDHSFQGVLYDLNIAYKKVKHMGWICGHDIFMNPDKTNNTYDFGVLDAVREFCFNNGLRLNYIFKDGCMSYAIQLFKPF